MQPAQTPWTRESEEEYRALDLRAHEILADVPLHDVWRVVLPSRDNGATMQDVLEIANAVAGSPRLPFIIRSLFAIRHALGLLFGWDRVPAGSDSRSYRSRLLDSDRASSLVPAGTHHGPFEILYVHSSEAVSEIQNSTVHAFLVFALRQKTNGYDLFFGIHVLPVNAGTRVYMALIDPFRRWFVYPWLLRAYHKAWCRTGQAV